MCVSVPTGCKLGERHWFLAILCARDCPSAAKKIHCGLPGQQPISLSFLQALWRSDPGCEAKSPMVLERLSGCSEPAVSGILPLPLLCLHVPRHHLRGAAGGGDRWPHSECLSSMGWHGGVFKKCAWMWH